LSKEFNKIRKEYDKVSTKLERTEQRLGQTKELSIKRKQDIDNLKDKLAASKETSINARHRIEQENKTKTLELENRNNILKLEVKNHVETIKGLRENVVEKKERIAQLNEKEKQYDSLIAKTAHQKVQTNGAQQRQELK